MQYRLFILLLFSPAMGHAQPGYSDIRYFYYEENNNDNTLHYFMDVLKDGRTTGGRCIGCAYAAERVGDYYRLKQDYEKAIAYYDSSGTHYRESLRDCGSGYFYAQFSKLYKMSQCYTALQLPAKAISILSPYMFDPGKAGFFDSTKLDFYVQTVRSAFSKEMIEHQLENAIKDIQKNMVYSGIEDSAQYFHVSCRVTLFGAKIQLAGTTTYLEDGNIPERHTRESYIRRFRELEIYRRLRQ